MHRLTQGLEVQTWSQPGYRTDNLTQIWSPSLVNSQPSCDFSRFLSAWTTAYNTDTAGSDLLSLPGSPLSPVPLCAGFGYPGGLVTTCAYWCSNWPNVGPFGPPQAPVPTPGPGDPPLPYCVGFVFVESPPSSGATADVGCCFLKYAVPAASVRALGGVDLYSEKRFSGPLFSTKRSIPPRIVDFRKTPHLMYRRLQHLGATSGHPELA